MLFTLFRYRSKSGTMITWKCEKEWTCRMFTSRNPSSVGLLPIIHLGSRKYQSFGCATFSFSRGPWDLSWNSTRHMFITRLVQKHNSHKSNAFRNNLCSIQSISIHSINRTGEVIVLDYIVFVTQWKSFETFL